MGFKIRTKIGIVFIILLIVILLLGFLYFIVTYQHILFMHKIQQEREELDLVKSLQLALVQAVMPANDFLIPGGDPNEPENFKALNAKVEDLIKKLDKPEFDRPEEREIFNNIKGDYLRVKDIALQIFSIHDPIGNLKAGRLMEEMDKIVGDASADMEKFHQFAHQEIEEALTGWQRTKFLLNLIPISGVSLSVVLIIGVLVYFARTISSPINSLKNAALEFAQGNLDKRVELATNDEISYLANAFNRMGSELKKSYTELKKAAIYIDAMGDALIVLNMQREVIKLNKAAEELLGYTQEEMAGLTFEKIFPEKEHKKHYAEMETAIKSGMVRYIETYVITKDGREIPVLLSDTAMKNPKGEPIGFVGVCRDITERRHAEEVIERQVSRLSALRSIDKAIIASLDLAVTLEVFITHVTTELHIDAASVLLLNQVTQMMEYVISKGFKTSALKYTRLRLGESNAGRAAIERRIVTIPNLKENIDGFARSELFADEDFITYIAVPLIAKGEVQGVLELFHRAPLSTEQDWLEFLENIANQAAIAIDNATLFNELQHSNIELTRAYDSTIEGWSHALDMRDKETEGHSQRVTELTVRIAQEFKIKDEELVHIRRGALLHDIGKMGIPDSILLKPGKLTEEEWTIMKLHPVYARDLLYPIEYLRSAIDIPYCHHEKWDGTGYPRGLKGEDIPLSARIFAVVDVWDALNSDRPYRPAWTKDKVLDHIRSQIGTHFDAEVVETFLAMEL